MQGFMQRHFLDFVQRLAQNLGTHDFIELIDVFEIGPHWDRLERLCKDKIDAIDAERDREIEENRRAAAERATMAVFERLDPTLIKTLPSRREDRRDPMILVVDDDQLSRTLVANVLNSDFKVTSAKSGAEAITEYLSSAPDVLFLDIGLPDINGHEVLECVFQMDRDGYVIMFSGRKDQDNMMRALQAGAEGFVGKPFTRDKLFECVRKSPFVIKKSEALQKSRHAH
jgi:CheY-like chemotaxis protein